MKRILFISLVLIVVSGLIAGLYVRSLIKGVPALMLRNAELKAAGYYMGEFENKMLSVIDHLNHGSYIKAATTLNRISREMKTTRGLVKLPDGSAPPEERLKFDLGLQDPTTGAFMDPSYPYFTYWSPTVNMIDQLAELADASHQPLKLKYPLRFLDQIRTPEQLRSYLDSLLYIDERWAEMGKPPYVDGVSELPYYDHLEDRGLYQFSQEWKDELMRWFTETQDPETGFWGARIRHGTAWRQDLDSGSTWHILHLFLDDEGRNRSDRYPLQHADALLKTTLGLMAKPMPADPAEQHDWSLHQAQKARIVALLWSHLSLAEQAQARAAMGTEVAVRYQHFFRPAEGSFSLYSGATADLDGTITSLSLLQAVGALPGTPERQRLWGDAFTRVPDLGVREVARWEDASTAALPPAQSIRVYRETLPNADAWEDRNLLYIFYPANSDRGLDIVDLRQRIARFLDASGQTYGNWASAESIRTLLGLNGPPTIVPVALGNPDLALAAAAAPGAEVLQVVGYDQFQVPIFRTTYRLRP